MANHLEGLSWQDVHGVVTAHHFDAASDGVLCTGYVDEPTMLDLDMSTKHLDLGSPDVVVVTAEDLFEQPENTLKLLCEALELDWDEHMLAWKPGGPEDGVWAMHWPMAFTAARDGSSQSRHGGHLPI